MPNRLLSRAGLVPSGCRMESVEARLMMAANYTYYDHIASLPGEHLGAGGAGTAPVIIDDLNGDGIKDIAASGVREQSATSSLVIGFLGLYSGADGSLIREILTPTTGSSETMFARSFALFHDADADGARDFAAWDSAGEIGNGTVRIMSAKTGAQIFAFDTGTLDTFAFRPVLAAAGDLNGDGIEDLIVTGPAHPTGQTTGYAFAHAFSGTNGAILWQSTLDSNPDDGFSGLDYRGIAPAGDVDGDGRADVLIGGDKNDNSHGYLTLLSGLNGTSLRTWRPASTAQGFGDSIAYLGDLDNDGVGEFAYVLTTPTSDTIASAILNVQSLDNSDLGAPDWSVSLGDWSRMGGINAAIANIGDLGNDGTVDIAVQINPLSAASSVRIVSGANGGTLASIATTALRPDRTRTTPVSLFGASIAGGDLDSDGITDLVIGASMNASPSEGKLLPFGFLSVAPGERLLTPIFTGFSPSGSAIGTIGGVPFATINNVITPVISIKGFQAGDMFLDRNSTGLILGAADSNRAGSFIIVDGVKILLANLPQVDAFFLNSNKPAGTYGAPLGISLSPTGDAGVVKMLRDGDIATTWMLRRNHADTGYELVYVADGTPVAMAGSESISVNGQLPTGGGAIAINNNDGTSASLAYLGSLFGEAKLYNAANFRASAVSLTAMGGFSADGLSLQIALLTSFGKPPGGVILQVQSITTSPTSIAASMQLLSISDDTVTYEPTAAPEDRLKLWTTVSGQWVSNPINAGTLANLPAGVTNFTQTPYVAIENKIFAIVSINGSADTAAQYLQIDPSYALPAFDPSRPVASTATGESGTILVGLNLAGQLVVMQRVSETSPWTSELVLNATVDVTQIFDVTAWNTGVAVATDKGVIVLLRNGSFSWEGKNLTETINGSLNITRSLRSMISGPGFVILAGLTADNQVVLYGSNAPVPVASTNWVFDNLTTTVLQAQGIADPNLQGDLITYVTPWDGLNIAGINSDGEPVTFWSAPGVSGWRFNNLADVQENPADAAGFTRLAVNVTPWGGISLTDSDSTLKTVWWAPALGGEWKFARLADAVGATTRPTLVASSVVGFTASWGGQNIAGVDADGHLWVYWWSPESDKWQAESLENAVPGLTEHAFSPRTSAYVSSGAIPMSLTAIDTANHAIQLYFKADTGWAFTDASALLI